MDVKELLEFLDTYNMAIKNKKECTNYILYNLEECPFCNGAHRDGAYIFHNKDGKIVAKCHHNSCRDASWAKLYEMKTGKKIKKGKGGNKEKTDSNKSFVDVINDAVNVGLLEIYLDEYGNLVSKIISVDNIIMKVIPVKSYEFRIHLQRLIYDGTNRVMDRKSYETVCDYLGVLAYKNNKRVSVCKRVYSDEEKIVYELDKDKNICVTINKDKIFIDNKSDIFFHHSKYYANQVLPDFESIKGKDCKMLIDLLKKYFNLKDKDITLFAIYLVSSFLGKSINHPIMSVSGQKGSGKSSFMRKFCQIVDPKNIGLGNIPKTEDDISLRISENYVNAFDNLSYLSKSISDLFCKCVTGGTNSRRTLYEDACETTFELKSIVVLNGIEIIISESDLLDRTLFFHLERLESNELKMESELDKEFEKDIPIILALCFSILQSSMKDEEPVDESGMIRLADFYVWAIRIARQLGYKDSYTISLLKKNQTEVNEQALSENPLAQVILIHMEYKEISSYTVTEMFKILKKLASEQQIDMHLWPKQPNTFSRKLAHIRSDLESMGITYEIKNKGYSKVITLKNSNPKREPIKMVGN